MNKCPFCCSLSEIIFKTKDLNRNVSNRDFEYRKCVKCGLIYLSDIPCDLESYYGQQYYCAPSVKKVKNVAKKQRYQLGMIKRFVKGGRLLEVGPGFGEFAYQAHQAGFNVDVIEKEESCCKFLSDKLGINAIKSDVPHKIIESLNNYDVIALWHVIEHLDNPWEFLKNAAKNLNSGGVLLVATPNPSASQFKIQKQNWPHVDAPRHLFLIPLSLLTDYLKPFGLETVAMTSNDKGARSWNRFGWQRYLMNGLSGKWPKRAAFILGYFVSMLMLFFDNNKGSAYTVIFQKTNK